MPEAGISAWSRRGVRAVVAVCMVALLATSFGGDAEPVAAGDLSGAISATRAGQSAYERSMRRADRAVARVVPRLKASRKKLRRAKQGVRRSRAQRDHIRRRIRQRVVIIRRIEDKIEKAVAESGDGDSGWVEKLRDELRRQNQFLAVSKRRKVAAERRFRMYTRRRQLRKRKFFVLRQRANIAIGRREAAEGALASRIVQMTRLAHVRADRSSDARLHSDDYIFAWPSLGKISQSYGCTGVRWNPRRGSCRHFHDGIDMVSGYGSPIRATAVGVIAYVGWNPWDERGRAFIVVVAHPGGFVSRYGHLVPSRRIRAGQVVQRGQTIGRMGSTGFSTGTHLHMELLQGTTPLNPLSYLPKGVVTVKAAKKAKKARVRAKRAKARKARVARRQRARVARQERREQKAMARLERGTAADAAVRSGLASLCDPQFPEGAVSTGGSSGVAVLDDPDTDGRATFSWTVPLDCATASESEATTPATDEAADETTDSEGVRLRVRGTSPLPE